MSFTDYKSLLAHRKTAHIGAERTQNYSHRKYTCPQKGCHRKKKSKGLVSVTSLREHQIKLKHWGRGTFHSPEGPVLCAEITPEDSLDSLHEESQAMGGAVESGDDDESMMGDDEQTLESQAQQAASRAQATQMHLQSQAQQAQQQQPLGHEALLPLIQATASMASNEALLHIDPAMQSQPRPSQGGTLSLQSSAASLSMPSMQSSLGGMSSQSMSGSILDQREAMMERYQQLQAEMESIRNIMSMQ